MQFPPNVKRLRKGPLFAGGAEFVIEQCSRTAWIELREEGFGALISFDLFGLKASGAFADVLLFCRSVEGRRFGGGGQCGCGGLGGGGGIV